MTTKHWAVYLEAAGTGAAPALVSFDAIWSQVNNSYTHATIPAGRVSSVAVDIPAGSAATINALPRTGPEVFRIDSGHPESLLGQSVEVIATSGNVTVVAAATEETFDGSLT